MPKLVNKFFIAALFLLSPWAQVQAAFSNYNSILIGDQSAGMAGAATAVAKDSSGAAWYNPATLAAMDGKSFSASVGIYKKFETRYGQGDDLVNAALRSNQGFFRALPSSTGSVIRPTQISWLQDWTLSLSILVPEFDSFRGDVNSTDTNMSTLSMIDESIWAGGAMARRISSSEFFGLTTYYTARSLTKTVNDRVYNSPTDFKIYNEERTLTQNAVVFILGYLKEFNPNWKLGISARLPSIQVAGRATYIENTIEETGSTGTNKNFTQLDSKTRIPTKFSVGLSYDDQDRWLIAGDIALYGQEQYRDVELDGVAENIEHRRILNASLGAEYKWNEWLKTRAGFFTNFSSHPDPDKNKVRGQGDKVDQLGFSANLAFRSGNIEYTFGGYYTGGNGKSVQRISGNYDLINKAQNTFTMLVGNSYSF